MLIRSVITQSNFVQVSWTVAGPAIFDFDWQLSSDKRSEKTHDNVILVISTRVLQRLRPWNLGMDK